MSRTSALLLLGVLIMLVSFSGLPVALRTLLTVVFGILVLGIGLSLRTHEVRQAQSPVPPTPAEPQVSSSIPSEIPTSVSPI
jgi:hypothetical protein